MRQYHNISRFRYRRFFSKGSHEEKTILWGATLKPGDVVGTCMGFNSRIATIRPCRARASDWFNKGSRRGGWFIIEYRITDTDGYWHTLPGGGCVQRRETVDEIRDFWLGIDFDDPKDVRAQGVDRFRDVVCSGFASGNYPVDADGILLPEFAELRRQIREAKYGQQFVVGDLL